MNQKEVSKYIFKLRVVWNSYEPNIVTWIIKKSLDITFYGVS